MFRVFMALAEECKKGARFKEARSEEEKRLWRKTFLKLMSRKIMGNAMNKNS